MIGSRIIRVNQEVCDECDVVISRELGGTPRFPKKRNVYYCTHKDLGTGAAVACIRKYPKTPKWCPEKDDRKMESPK